MLATFFGTLFAIFFLFFMPAEGIEKFDHITMTILFIGVGSVVLITGVLANFMMSVPLQRAEQEVTPCIFRALRKKWSFRIASSAVLLFPFLSFLATFGLHPPLPLVIAVWVILLGIAIDSFHLLIKWSFVALNPFEAITLLSQNARHYFTPGEGGNFCLWVDALIETALKAIDRSSTSLCDNTIKELEDIATSFLKERTLMGSKEEDDELNYTICFFLQRLEQVHTKAAERLLEMISSKIIVTTGKIAIAVAKYHPAWASLPLNSIGKMTQEAQSYDLDDVAIKASITLQQIGKKILDDDPSLQLPIQDMFFTILGRLEKIAQTTFRKDKTTNIDVLIHPFRDMKHWFTEEKYKNHPDAAAIVNDLERVMGEFEALEMVLRTMPNIPGMPEEEEEEPPENISSDLQE